MVNTHELSCSIVRVWKGAHDVCQGLPDGKQAWNDAADILEVAFDEINSLIYKIDTFASRFERAKTV